jgi:parallel beta-helix repeat protein
VIKVGAKTILIPILFLLFFSTIASAVRYIDNCWVLDVYGETYILTTDLIDKISYYCLDIRANNITLDCNGHLVDGVDQEKGIRLYGVSGVTVKNCIVRDWVNGIWLENSNENKLISIEAYSNFDAIFLYGSNSNILENIISHDNDDEGITFFAESKFNTLRNSSFFKNYDGIVLKSSNNTIEGVVVINQTYNGIVINTGANYNLINRAIVKFSINDGFGITGSYNTISNSIISDNEEGIVIRDAGNNVIKNNFILNNHVKLIRAFNNVFYNNLFNHTENVVFIDTIYVNVWNTTETPITNIIGGNWIGGNYWGKPDRTGYSDTCTPVRYNFCSPYNLTTDNIDYLPLTTLPPPPPPPPVPPAKVTYVEVLPPFWIIFIVVAILCGLFEIAKRAGK